ncbi:BnaC05g10570D [Brassica napus]|uniref:(rape) hypothetical protein n=1 Tax=Brassica napus TaxID=3708 RepID=A0A078HN67_BRANA|nr:unnamed protein product [Brassica napus]CDY39322.1 BnaC05g10570D [Brassica napus]
MEQHKLVRIPVILKGPNYITWSRLTRTALGGRGLWEHITTSYTKRMKFCTDKLFKVFREFIDIKTADKSLRNDPKFASNRDFLDALLDLTVGEEAELD